MKKILNFISLLTVSYTVQAQEATASGVDEDVFNITASIFTLALVMLFFLSVMKRLLDHRIKKRIVEKGVPESVASALLHVNPKEDRNSNIKWFTILMGIGIALTIIHYTLPLGIHSLAIMAFCVAGSFLSYFFFSKYSEK
ncbi:hypothetical protein [Runella sp.]|uniref:hypothetical protein n=1 Tax=Runella sp. TaxID=1960881 RepID=UPI003D0B02A9